MDKDGLHLPLDPCMMSIAMHWHLVFRADWAFDYDTSGTCGECVSKNMGYNNVVPRPCIISYRTGLGRIVRK